MALGAAYAVQPNPQNEDTDRRDTQRMLSNETVPSTPCADYSGIRACALHDAGDAGWPPGTTRSSSSPVIARPRLRRVSVRFDVEAREDASPAGGGPAPEMLDTRLAPDASLHLGGGLESRRGNRFGALDTHSVFSLAQPVQGRGQ